MSPAFIQFNLLDRPHFLLLWYKCLCNNICFWASWDVGYSLNVRKKDVGAWSVGVVFILFFLSALIGKRRVRQCLAWWKSVMAHWNRVGLFSISSDLSLKRLRWAALKVLGWVDVTRHNVLFLLSLQIYQPFPGMVCFQNCNQSDIIVIVILIILNPLLLIHFLILLYTRTLDNGSISAHNRRRGCAGYTQLLTQQTLHFQLLDILVSFSTFGHVSFIFNFWTS